MRSRPGVRVAIHHASQVTQELEDGRSAFSTRPVDGSYFDPARRLGKVLLFQGSFSKMNSADSRILPPFRGGVRWWTFRGHWLVSCEHYDLLSLNILEARPYLITDAVHSSTSIPTPFCLGGGVHHLRFSWRNFRPESAYTPRKQRRSLQHVVRLLVCCTLGDIRSTTSRKFVRWKCDRFAPGDCDEIQQSQLVECVRMEDDDKRHKSGTANCFNLNLSVGQSVGQSVAAQVRF